MRKFITLFALCAAAACGSTLNGTLGWVPTSNTVAFTGLALGSAGSVSIPALETVNALPGLYLGAPNDFAALALLGSMVDVSDPVLAVSHINGGFFADLLPAYAQFAGASRFEFDIASVQWTTSAPTNLSLLADGTLIDHLGIFSATSAAISGSFTTTGSGAVNASFTLTTQAAEVPEPPFGTLAGLVIGMLLGAINRKAR